MNLCVLFRDFDNGIVCQVKVLCEKGFGLRVVGPDSLGFSSARSMLPKTVQTEVVLRSRRPLPILDPQLILGQLISAIRTNSSVCCCHGMNELVCGLALKALRRSVIYEVADDMPSILGTIVGRRIGSQGLGRFLESVLRGLEVTCCSQFDKIVALTYPLAKARSRYNKETRTIGYYPHPCFNPSNVDTSLMEKYKRFNLVVYDGRITPEKGMDIMLEVSDMVRQEIENYRLLLIGDFVGTSSRKREFLQRRSDLGLQQHVELAGWIPYSDVPKYINLGKLGLSLLSPWCYSYLVTEPYKVLEMMACGKPVVATRDNLPTRLLIEQSGGGVLVGSSDVRAIADSVTRLLQNHDERRQLGVRARWFIENRRKWGDFEQSLLSVYEPYFERMR